MNRATLPVFAAIACLALPGPVPAEQPAGTDTCLMLIGNCIAAGPGNFFLYHLFSNREIEFREGDVLEYDVYLAPANPMAKGGVEVLFSDGGTPLRDVRGEEGKIRDQNGLTSHGDAILEKAVGAWYARRIPLDAVAGRTANAWTLVFEGDEEGVYVQFVDNVAVARADGSLLAVYEDGPPTRNQIDHKEGYSKYPVLEAVERAQVIEGLGLASMIDRIAAEDERRREIEELREGIDLVEQLIGEGAVADEAERRHMAQHTAEARAIIDRIESDANLSAEAYQSALHQANQILNHTHPVMREYTGHLVGHAHIDFQWLWEWPDVRDNVIPQTFGQAIRFMDEFPGFTFSQSSSALYAAAETYHPDLFSRMRTKIEAGQWEIVGGRVCEGDTHMISAESHARHFLYGQRYFRERFGGRQAVVGWEPDTFGHTWQMPQILRLGGCDAYYFCRGGHGHPLFWWEAPDGSRVLAFEESAMGSWYNSDLADRQFREMAWFAQRYGSRDMLWVYGVGNHGGGPTREHIATALRWQAKDFLPAVKFSTATEFFRMLRERVDLEEIPVVRDELNTDSHCGFRGCYTTHSDVKRWNRDAEAVTESAEAIAAFASLGGFEYPAAEFRRNWEDITWNHHHDTLPGTSIHASYNLSREMYERVIASSRDIALRALDHLSHRIGAPSGTAGAASLIVFNPCGWPRSGFAEAGLPESRPAADGDGAFWAVAPDGSAHPIQRMPGEDGAGPGMFVAQDIPSFGYRVYRVEERPAPSAASGARAEVVRDAGGAPSRVLLENDRFRVEIELPSGAVSRILDRRLGRELIRPGGSARLEIHEEKGGGMSAWRIGEIASVSPLPGTAELVEAQGGPVIACARLAWSYASSRIEQTIRLADGWPAVEFVLDVEWNEQGGEQKLNPFLKAAFDLNLEDPAAAYEIPFGAIERPANNVEVPALKWADLTEYAAAGEGEAGRGPATWGVGLVNDCKHGHSAEGSTLRLSLIRCSYDPDPTPDIGHHRILYALAPHEGDGRVELVRLAGSINRPLWTVAASGSTTGALPAEHSFLRVEPDGVVVTAAKRAEDDDDLVLRFYESEGRDVEARVWTAFAMAGAREVNFLEDDLGEVASQRHAVSVPLGHHRIKTLKLRPAVVSHAGTP